jgi:hypothetical protein
MSLYECEECGRSEYDAPLSPSKRRRQRQETIQQTEAEQARIARREQWRKDNPTSAALADSLDAQARVMRLVYERNLAYIPCLYIKYHKDNQPNQPNQGS